MTTITFLGTAYAVPNKDHQNTHFILESGEHLLLVDCVGNPVVRLEQAGFNPLAITDLVLTHFHPDHVSGVPLLLLDLWLMGRKEPLPIYGLHDVIIRLEKMMALYKWEDWKGFYPIELHRIPSMEMTPLIQLDGFQVLGSPVMHMIPAMGLRITTKEGSIGYSTDTRPCDAVVRLAEGADILIHEATGEGDGHSFPMEAGMIAQRAGVKELYLVHYRGDSDPNLMIEEAKSTFNGKVVVATDLMRVTLE
jgi:ribonuclease Z